MKPASEGLLAVFGWRQLQRHLHRVGHAGSAPGLARIPSKGARRRDAHRRTPLRAGARRFRMRGPSRRRAPGSGAAKVLPGTVTPCPAWAPAGWPQSALARGSAPSRMEAPAAGDAGGPSLPMWLHSQQPAAAQARGEGFPLYRLGLPHEVSKVRPVRFRGRTGRSAPGSSSARPHPPSGLSPSIPRCAPPTGDRTNLWTRSGGNVRGEARASSATISFPRSFSQWTLGSATSSRPRRSSSLLLRP